MILAEIDWRWVAGVVTASAITWIGKLQREVNELRSEIYELRNKTRLYEQPIPSNGSDEQKEIEEAREIARRQGIKISFHQAAMITARVRADREKKKAKKENIGGDGQRN